MSRSNAMNYLIDGNERLLKKDIYSAIRYFRNAIAEDTKLTEAYFLLGKAFLDKGFAEHARVYFRRAISLDSQHSSAEKLLELATTLIEVRRKKLANKKFVLGYTVHKYLGAGWEGAVYLVTDKQNKKWVLKKFYPHEVEHINYKGMGGLLRIPAKSPHDDLINLSKNLNAHTVNTMYPISLIVKGPLIVAIKYPYEKLYNIPNYLIRRTMDIKLALCGAMCRTQAYLLKEVEQCVADPINSFMVNSKGNIRYIDYGPTIIATHDYRCQTEHHEVKSFIKLLYHLWNPNKENIIEERGLNIALDNEDGLIDFAQDSPIIAQILDTIAQKKLELFLDYKFYDSLAQHLPNKLSKISLFKIIEHHVSNKIRNVFKHIYIS